MRDFPGQPGCRFAQVPNHGRGSGDRIGLCRRPNSRSAFRMRAGVLGVPTPDHETRLARRSPGHRPPPHPSRAFLSRPRAPRPRKSPEIPEKPTVAPARSRSASTGATGWRRGQSRANPSRDGFGQMPADCCTHACDARATMTSRGPSGWLPDSGGRRLPELPDDHVDPRYATATTAGRPPGRLAQAGRALRAATGRVTNLAGRRPGTWLELMRGRAAREGPPDRGGPARTGGGRRRPRLPRRRSLRAVAPQQRQPRSCQRRPPRRPAGVPPGFQIRHSFAAGLRRGPTPIETVPANKKKDPGYTGI